MHLDGEDKMLLHLIGEAYRLLESQHNRAIAAHDNLMYTHNDMVDKLHKSNKNWHRIQMHRKLFWKRIQLRFAKRKCQKRLLTTQHFMKNLFENIRKHNTTDSSNNHHDKGKKVVVSDTSSINEINKLITTTFLASKAATPLGKKTSNDDTTAPIQDQNEVAFDARLANLLHIIPVTLEDSEHPYPKNTDHKKTVHQTVLQASQQEVEQEDTQLEVMETQQVTLDAGTGMEIQTMIPYNKEFVPYSVYEISCSFFMHNVALFQQKNGKKFFYTQTAHDTLAKNVQSIESTDTFDETQLPLGFFLC